MIGWIKLHRITTEHWIWTNPIKFQWWVRMLMEVNHSNKEILIGNTLYMIERGQSGKSLRTWALLFGVGTKAVVNFFELLEKDEMIIRKTIGKGKHSTTLIIISNYENYQGIEETLKPTQGATLSTTQEQHEGHTNKNDKEIINNDNNEKEDNTPNGVVDLKNQPTTTNVDLNKMISFFNENRGVLPEVKSMSDVRKKRILSLEKKYGKKSIQNVIEKVRDSDFLQGQNKEGWTASFDWIFKPANFLKILEDNFLNKENNSATKTAYKFDSARIIETNFVKKQFRFSSSEAANIIEKNR